MIDKSKVLVSINKNIITIFSNGTKTQIDTNENKDYQNLTKDEIKNKFLEQFN